MPDADVIDLPTRSGSEPAIDPEVIEIELEGDIDLTQKVNGLTYAEWLSELVSKFKQ